MVGRSTDASDELELAERAARGDHSAFAAIVRAYESQLYAHLVNMLGDPEAARDAAQDTFLAAYRALPRWRPPDDTRADALRPLSPWLYRIATNKALSVLRARALRPAATTCASAHAAAADGFEDRFAARELLQRALHSVSEEDAACLVLHYVAGEHYGEIALKLGLSSEAVRKRVSRSLTALRAAYSALDSEARQ